MTAINQFEMNTDKRQLLLIVILNATLGLALFFGIKQTVHFVNTISNVTIHSFNEFSTVFQTYALGFLSLDIKIIFGVLASIGIVFYDIVMMVSYFKSFALTSKKTCKSCSKRLIREQRLTGDRILSYVVPLKRFRCVGCGQQYLRLDNGGNHSHDHATAHDSSVQTEKIKA